MPTTQFAALKHYIDEGVPGPDDFELLNAEVSEDLQPGEVLLELIYFSVDPYMRGRMRDDGGHWGSFPLGEPVVSLALAQVKASKAPDVAVGSYVKGYLKWQQLQVAKAQEVTPVWEEGLRKAGLPLSVELGALGMTGFTAYSSLKVIAKLKPGETIFVSGAAGAVGLIVGQLAKNVYGATVIGSAGSDEKVKQLANYGYDHVFNYKKEKPLDALKRLAPKGIDVYYDNVGGETLEAALEVANAHARVVACGSISGYNTKAEDRYGVRNLFAIIYKRILIQGFIQGDYTADHQADFIKDFHQYLLDGKIKNVEHVFEGGLAQAGQAYHDMMVGVNFGKAVVAAGPDPLRIAN